MFLQRIFDRFCAAAALSFVLTSGLWAQSTGAISGFVTDPSGLPVPAATVTAVLVQQQVHRTVQSGQDGSFLLTALLPGDYTLTVEKQGFQRVTQTNLVLAVNQNLRVDAQLRVGQTSETVTVSAEAPLVDTRSGALAGLVDDRRVVDLPINGRNVIALAATLPGIVSVNAPQQLTDARSGPSMNVNGSLENQNLFTFNGGIFVNPSRNTGMNFPPPDAVKEFSIQTQNFSAEYGRNVGAQVNVVSKSGTNELHGSVWEFLRNEKLNARNFFASRVPARKQNQYGFAIGAPIKRDKLFAFGSYQGLRDRREALSVQANVPNSAQRAGDFTGSSRTLRNPTNIDGTPFTDASGAACVADNRIRSTCISPVAKALVPLIPDSPSGRVSTFSPSPQNGALYLGRVDWVQSERNNVYGHIFIDDNSRNRPTLISGNVPNYLSDTLAQRTTMATINDTFTVRPNLLTETSITFLRTASLLAANKTVEPASVGINMPLFAEVGGASIDIGSNVNFGGGSGRVDFKNNSWQIRNSTTWMSGRHNIKFGGEFLKQSFRQIFLGTPRFNFNGTRSGDEFADFLLGSYYQLSGGFGVRTNDNLQTAPSFFVQDEFKVRPSLTLTLGLRWEPFFPWVDRYDRLQSLNGITTRAQSTRFPLAPPGILFAGDPGVPRGLAPNDMNNFAPRFGFAWDVFGNGKTSVRGGYGFYYDSIKADSVSQENAPWAGGYLAFNGRIENPFSSVGQVTPPVAPSQFDCTQTSAFPGVRCGLYPLPLNGLYIAPNIRTPYVQSWNLTLQHQLMRDLIVEASYVGKAGIKLEGYRNFNPAQFINDPVTGAPPSLQNVQNRTVFLPGILASNSIVLDNSFRSWYNGLQLQARRRFSHGLTFNVNYTFSRSIDTLSSNIFSRLLDNPFNLADNKGLSDFNRSHVFVASWLWAPQMRSDWRSVNAVFNGWTLTGIHQFQSGAPFSVRAGADVALDGSGSRQRAALAPGAGPITRDWSSRDDMISKYFNTSAFLRPAQATPGTYGNSGRNILTGPRFVSTNFSVLRDFPLAERLKLQFRSEFFNLFNQVNFGTADTTGGANNPDNTVTSSTFGRIRTAGAAREIQFALKLIW
jgi:hypothetical protein